MASTCSFCALMLLGPSPTEIDRARDTFDSLFHYEPGISEVVLVDDSLDGRSLKPLTDHFPPQVHLRVLKHPRRGKGLAVHGAMADGVLHALHAIHDEMKADFILKLDSDALVIAPFTKRVCAFFHLHPNAGMAGQYDLEYDGSPRSQQPWVDFMRLLIQPIRIYRPAPNSVVLWLSVFGRRKAIRNMLESALSHGHIPGHNVQGGSYVLSRDTLRRMNDHQYFDHAGAWQNIRIPEDVIISTYVGASGKTLHGLSGPGQVFGVQCFGLPAPKEVLSANTNAIIHSIKNTAEPEQAIRTYFAALRSPQSAPSVQM